MAETNVRRFQRGDTIREASNPAAVNQLLWDGYTELEGDASVDDRSPAQKAAATRAKKSTGTRRAPKAKPVAASGDTADGEKTEGISPS